jgi:hypothetical protein
MGGGQPVLPLNRYERKINARLRNEKKYTCIVEHFNK